MRCTSMMLPAVSLPDSPRRSLQPEKVHPTIPCVASPPHPYPPHPRHTRPFSRMVPFLPALATLKPQAGLIVPQAVPSSQPSVVVSVPSIPSVLSVCHGLLGAPWFLQSRALPLTCSLALFQSFKF